MMIVMKMMMMMMMMLGMKVMFIMKSIFHDYYDRIFDPDNQ